MSPRQRYVFLAVWEAIVRQRKNNIEKKQKRKRKQKRKENILFLITYLISIIL